MKIDKIFLVPHFHFDFEWWKEEPYHEQDTLIIIDEAIIMLDTFPEFTYVFDSVLPLKQYIENRPGGLEKIKGFLAEGRIEIVGGDIVAPDEVIPIGEALIRQFEEGQQWLQEVFGIQSQVAWEIDEFAHPARMPQVLAPLGFKYFVFARGVKPYDSMHPTLFNWIDPAGQCKLLSYWWPAHYEGSQPGSLNSEKSKKNQIKRFFTEMESRIEFEGARSPVPWLMVPLGGDFVIPNSIWIDFVNEWNRTKDIKLEFSLPSNYFEAIKQFEVPDFTGLFPHVFDGYFTSREKEKQACRKNAYALCEQEKLISLATSVGYIPSQHMLKEAWWQVLKGDFHDTIAGTGTDRVFRKTMERYANAEKLQDAMEEKVVSFLTSVLKGEETYIFNSLNWSREEVIQVVGIEKLIKAAPLSLAKLDIVEKPETPIVINDTGVENKYLKIQVDEMTGELIIYDKEKGFYPIQKGGNRTSIIDDAGNLWVTRSSDKKYPIRLTGLKVEKKSDFTGVITVTEENHFIEIHKEIVLHSHSKRIDFKTDIHYKGKDKRIDIKFPFSYQGEWKTENVFHTEKATHGIYPVQNFALFEGENYKVAILNKGIPGYLLEKNTGSIMLMRSVSVFSWALIRWALKNVIPIFKHFKEAGVYLRNKLNIMEFPIYPVHNLFLRTFASEGDIDGHGALSPKNHRRAKMNFYKESLAWERGNHAFQYALLLDANDTTDAVRAGLEFNNPLWQKTIAGTGQHHSIALLSNEIKDVIITSVRPYENGWLMRVYEPQGKSVSANISFGIPINKVYKINGAQKAITELKYEGNELVYMFAPFEMVQFYVS